MSRFRTTAPTGQSPTQASSLTAKTPLRRLCVSAGVDLVSKSCTGTTTVVPRVYRPQLLAINPAAENAPVCKAHGRTGGRPVRQRRNRCSGVRRVHGQRIHDTHGIHHQWGGGPCRWVAPSAARNVTKRYAGLAERHARSTSTANGCGCNLIPTEIAAVACDTSACDFSRHSLVASPRASSSLRA